jgi:hypothetical protein
MKLLIGNYRIPKIRLRVLLECIVDLEKKFHDREFTKDELKVTLNLSESSSGLPQTIQDLRSFKLIADTNRNFRITELGISVLNVDSTQRSVEVEKVVRNNDLWAVLLNTVGKNPDQSAFNSALLTITKEKETEIQPRYKEIFDAFQADVECIIRFDPNLTRRYRRAPRKQKQEKSQNSSDGTHNIQTPLHVMGGYDTGSSPQIKGYKISSDYAGFQIEVKDEQTYKLAINLLKSIKNELIQRNVKFVDTD